MQKSLIRYYALSHKYRSFFNVFMKNSLYEILMLKAPLDCLCDESNELFFVRSSENSLEPCSLWRDSTATVRAFVGQKLSRKCSRNESRYREQIVFTKRRACRSVFLREVSSVYLLFTGAFLLRLHSPKDVQICTPRERCHVRLLQ